MKPDFDLLSEVKNYFAAATPDEIKRDMAAAEFDAFEGIGDEISPRSNMAVPVPVYGQVQASWEQQLMGLLWTGPTVASLTVPVTLNAQILSPGKSIRLSALCGNTEEIPLAA